MWYNDGWLGRSTGSLGYRLARGLLMIVVFAAGLGGAAPSHPESSELGMGTIHSHERLHALGHLVSPPHGGSFEKTSRK